MKDAGADALRAALEAAVGGQYKVLRLVGRGAMGAVYLAREAALERLVAIKVLPPEAAGDADRRARFRREARTAARLMHPNIVPLHSFGENDAVMYFVMGYVTGESLAARLKREVRVSPEEARRILGDVAQALDYAHRQGVVHRDVKPDNILIDDESGRAMLTDFGIARAAGSGGTLTEAGSILGTPHFMAPEQASGGAVDGRADVYALGVTGFALLSGRLPFEGADAREVLMQVIGKPAPSLAAVAPVTPPDLVRAIDRCLEKDAAARWPDARSLAEALGAGAAEGPLPEALEEVEERGFWAALWGLGVLFVADIAHLFWDELHPLRDNPLAPVFLTVFTALGVVPAIVVIGFLWRAWRAWRRGVEWREVLKVAFHHPRTWTFWYPRSLRRQGDVWDRLPPPVKRLRLAATATMVCGLGLVLSFMGVAAAPTDEVREPLFLMLVVSFFAFAPVASVVGFLRSRAGRWAREQGLAPSDHARVLYLEATSRTSFWRRPEIARLLLPPRSAAGAAASDPRTPTEYVSAIERAVREGRGSAPGGGAEAIAAARTAAEALRVLDETRARLAADADAAEAARLRQKLEALGPESDGEADARRQLRSLLEQQLEVLEGVQARLDEHGARRAALADALRELWRGMAQGSGGAASVDKLRAACAEIEKQSASAEVVDLPTLPR